MVSLGGTLYQTTLPASRALQRYAQGDLHAFVGFLDYYAGGTRTMRGNLFVNVRDAGVPTVTVIQSAPDAQRSDHVVNIRYDSLFLGGGIPTAIPRRFYQLFGDDYDFLGVVEQADVYANRNYQGVKNTETGFGSTAFDRTSGRGQRGPAPRAWWTFQSPTSSTSRKRRRCTRSATDGWSTSPLRSRSAANRIGRSATWPTG